MPSKSKAQARLMAAVAHNPKFAKRVGIPQSVGRDFNEHDKRTGILKKAGGGRVKALGELAQKLKAHMPREGFRSTLEDLIRTAPMDQAPASEWRSYLRPGRMLEREGVQFPLKAEELKYSGVNETLSGSEGRVSRSQILESLKKKYPKFEVAERSGSAHGSDVEASMEGVYGYGDDFTDRLPRYSEQAFTTRDPNKPGTPYLETRTNSKDFGAHPTHFEDGTISHSRATDHDTEDGLGVRLIEEIQSDRHQNANDLISDYYGTETLPDGQRALGETKRGYRTPEEEIILEAHRKYANNPERFGEPLKAAPRRAETHEFLHNLIPDAPFKDPKEYAAVEMKKHILDAVNGDQQYVALTTGDDQVKRYAQAMDEGDPDADGMHHIYDKIYPSVMKSLANQYGGKLTKVKIPVESTVDIRPRTLVDYESENLDDFFDFEFGHELGEQISAYQQLSKDYKIALEDSSDEAVQSALVKLPKLINKFKKSMQYQDFDAVRQDKQNVFNLFQVLDDAHSKSAVFEPDIKEFPAIEITPEMREKVKKAGVSLFTIPAAVGVGISALQSARDPQEPSPEGYAVGGQVHVFGQDPLRGPPMPSPHALGQSPLLRLQVERDAQKRAREEARGVSQQTPRSLFEATPANAFAGRGRPGLAPRLVRPEARPGAPPSPVNGGRPSTGSL